MRMTWQNLKLGELAEFRNGVNYTQDARHSGGLPIIGVKDFQDRLTVDFKDLEELDPAQVDVRESLVRVGDILFVRSNGNRALIGRSMLVAESPQLPTTHSGFTIRLRFRDERANPRFFGYLLRSPLIRQTLSSQGGGTNISNLNQGILAALEVPVPPPHVQDRIAAILGAYDDLIEVNRRRISLLEEMARRLFEEWFVQFRLTSVEGAASLPEAMPAGWSMVKLSAICAVITRGIAPKYDELSSSLVIGQKCIRGQRLDLGPARRQSKCAPVEKLVRAGDVLINSTGVGTLGRLAQVEKVPEGTTVDSHVTIVRAGPSVQRDYFGMAMLRLQPLFEGMGVGATGQTELNRGRVADVEIVLPEAAVQAAFGLAVRPMRELAHCLIEQSEKLSDARDLLLPRLISGELRVGAAERVLEAVA